MTLMIMGVLAPLSCLLLGLWHQQAMMHDLMIVRDRYCFERDCADKGLARGIESFIKQGGDGARFPLAVAVAEHYEVQVTCQSAEKKYPNRYCLSAQLVCRGKPSLSVACMVIKRRDHVLVDYYTIGAPVW